MIKRLYQLTILCLLLSSNITLANDVISDTLGLVYSGEKIAHVVSWKCATLPGYKSLPQDMTVTDGEPGVDVYIYGESSPNYEAKSVLEKLIADVADAKATLFNVDTSNSDGNYSTTTLSFLHKSDGDRLPTVTHAKVVATKVGAEEEVPVPSIDNNSCDFETMHRLSVYFKAFNAKK